MPAADTKSKPGKPATPGEARDDELFLIDGNSLAYRAFFALPESIATADGRPTNAIYGFASMMVKMLTDFRPKGVIVAWDAGWSGREKQYAEYKAQRKSRPDLLKEQWPHLAPLAEAFGFTNVQGRRLRGRRRDRHARPPRPAPPGIPVMVVSGDRDVYQVVGDGIRVMTTSRGVTDTRIYDHDERRRALRRPAGAGPRPDRAQGRHLRQHPRRPGHRRQDRRPAAAEVRLAGGGARVGRRDLGRQAQGEPHQARRRRPRLQAAGDAAVRPRRPGRRRRARCAETPDRSRLREVAAEFELRAGDPAPRGGVRRGRPRPRGRRDDPGRVGRGHARRPRHRADRDGDPRRALGGHRRREGRHRRRLATWSRSPETSAAGPWSPTTPRASAGRGAPGSSRAAKESLDLAHDTMVAAYLIDPARRVYDLHELAADAGLAAAPATADPGQLSLEAEEGEAAGDPAVDARLDPRARRAPARADRRVRARARAERGRDAAGRGALGDGAGRHPARRRPARRDRRGHGRADRPRSRRRSTTSPGTSSRSARRSSSRRSSSTSSG